LRAAFANEPFYGVLEEIASALGRTKSAMARDLLIGAVGHANPKVRRAVAAALGAFRDERVADALLAPAANDASYFVRGAALTSLGRTRDARAFEILSKAVRERTWNSTVEAGAVRGLAELSDPRATPLVIDAAQIGQDEGLRRSAVSAVGRIGELLEADRTKVVDALIAFVDDPMFLVQLSAIAAVESLEDARLLGTLDRLGQSAFDGRVRRDAMEAAIRIREGKNVPSQVSTLREDVESLREEQRKIQEKIEALSPT
jgi:aminopeptidase N